jgi:GTP-binding protein
MTKINFSNAKFLGAYVDKEAIMHLDHAEFILMGRSNVGKSSLINSLTRKQIAKTSSTPGKTETINHYEIDDKISIFDLPGYGFAKFKSKRLAWSDFIDQFIEENGSKLRAFLLLIDSRHDLSEEDVVMIDYLKKFSSPLVVIFTKVDKLKSFELKKNIESLSEQIKQVYINHFVILPFSTKLSEYCKNLEKMMGIWAK